MQQTICNRCGTSGTARPAILRGEPLDLCDDCTDAVIGDRSAWVAPPRERGDGTVVGGFTRPPVNGVTADELDPGHAARRDARTADAEAVTP